MEVKDSVGSTEFFKKPLSLIEKDDIYETIEYMISVVEKNTDRKKIAKKKINVESETLDKEKTKKKCRKRKKSGTKASPSKKNCNSSLVRQAKNPTSEGTRGRIMTHQSPADKISSETVMTHQSPADKISSEPDMAQQSTVENIGGTAKTHQRSVENASETFNPVFKRPSAFPGSSQKRKKNLTSFQDVPLRKNQTNEYPESTDTTGTIMEQQSPVENTGVTVKSYQSPSENMCQPDEGSYVDIDDPVRISNLLKQIFQIKDPKEIDKIKVLQKTPNYLKEANDAEYKAKKQQNAFSSVPEEKILPVNKTKDTATPTSAEYKAKKQQNAFSSVPVGMILNANETNYTATSTSSALDPVRKILPEKQTKDTETQTDEVTIFGPSFFQNFLELYKETQENSQARPLLHSLKSLAIHMPFRARDLPKPLQIPSTSVSRIDLELEQLQPTETKTMPPYKPLTWADFPLLEFPSTSVSSKIDLQPQSTEAKTMNIIGPFEWGNSPLQYSYTSVKPNRNLKLEYTEAKKIADDFLKPLKRTSTLEPVKKDLQLKKPKKKGAKQIAGDLPKPLQKTSASDPVKKDLQMQQQKIRGKKNGAKKIASPKHVQVPSASDKMKKDLQLDKTETTIAEAMASPKHMRVTSASDKMKKDLQFDKTETTKVERIVREDADKNVNVTQDMLEEVTENVNVTQDVLEEAIAKVIADDFPKHMQIASDSDEMKKDLQFDKTETTKVERIVREDADKNVNVTQDMLEEVIENVNVTQDMLEEVIEIENVHEDSIEDVSENVKGCDSANWWSWVPVGANVLHGKTIIMICGDVMGNFKILFSKVEKMMKKNILDKCRYLFCVGEFFGDNSDELNDLKSGKIKVPVQTYILGANNPVYEEYYNWIDSIPNINYLGKSGHLSLSSGLEIAYLSGVEKSVKETEAPRSNVHFSEEDVNNLISMLDHRPMIDILLTSSWPAGIMKNVPSIGANYEAKISRHMSPLIAKLAKAVKPRYHFCGLADVYYERTPYRNVQCISSVETSATVTKFFGLGYVEVVSRRKFVQAFKITPARCLDSKRLFSIEGPTTDCPYGTIDTQYFFDPVHGASSSDTAHTKKPADGHPPPCK